MFEGYRRVVLARSRDLGPRVVPLLTADLVFEKRSASWTEEAILDAAELLDDKGWTPP